MQVHINKLDQESHKPNYLVGTMAEVIAIDSKACR